MLSCFQCSPEDMDREAEERHCESKARYRDNVHQQLINTLREKRCQCENNLIDKKHLDDVLQSIYDEDVSERQLKEDIAEHQHKDIQTCKFEKSARHGKEKIMSIDKDKQIENYERKMQDRSSSETEVRAKNQAAREAHSTEAGDKYYMDKQNKYIEEGLRYDIAKKLDEKAACDELMSALDAQISDLKAEAVKHKVEDHAYREKLNEYIERDLQYEIDEKFNAKAASDELARGLDAQIRDHKAKAVKQKMEDQAFNERQHEYIEKDRQYDIAEKMHEKAASEELARGLDAQIRDHKAQALKQKMEDCAFNEREHEYIEKDRQYDIAEKMHEKLIAKAASEELARGLDAQIRDHKAQAVKQKMEDCAFNERQHVYLEKEHQYDIAEKMHEKAASEELAMGLDAQIRDHKAQAVKQKMEDCAYNERQHKYFEKGLQYEINEKLNVKAASDALTSGLDAQVRDHKAEAVKHKMEDYAFQEMQEERIEEGLQYDIAEKMYEKAASEELAIGLDAQISEHNAEAAKQKMEDYAYREQQDEYIEKGLQYDIAERLHVKAASDELTIGLDAQVSDHKAEAAKQKMEDYAYREQMMEEIEEARLLEEEEMNLIKAKNQIYRAELLLQIEDNKKRREKERRLNM